MQGDLCACGEGEECWLRWQFEMMFAYVKEVGRRLNPTPGEIKLEKSRVNNRARRLLER